MDKLTFMKRIFLFGAVATAIALLIKGLCTPNIEATVTENIGKYVVMWVWVTAVVECLLYTLGQVIYDWTHGYKQKYGKGWFLAGVKEDLQWIKGHITWKGTFKVIGAYLLFAIIFGVVILGLEAIFP